MSKPPTTAHLLLPSLLGVKHWSEILSHAARDTTPIAPLKGEDENSIIQVKTEPRRTRATASPSPCWLAWLQTFSEGQTAIGNAEAMTHYSQSAVINEIGTTCAPPSQNSIDHQPM